MDFKEFTSESFNAAAKNSADLAKAGDVITAVAKAGEIIIKSYQVGGCLFIAGNGGSAADAQHISAELVAKLDKDRTSLPAIALTTDTSLLTAIGNDYGYDYSFSRQLMGLAKKGDVFLAITTSGNSKNIIKALEICRQKGITSILLTGKSGGLAKEQGLADYYIIAPGPQTAAIQEAHMTIYHTLCFMIEKGLAESGHVQYF